MRRLLLPLTLLAAAALAAQGSAADLAANLADDLSEGDTTAFLAHFDQKLPGRDRLESYISTLVNTGDVGNSIEVRTDEGDDRRRTLELDWILELSTGKRRAAIHCTIEHRARTGSSQPSIQWTSSSRKISITAETQRTQRKAERKLQSSCSSLRPLRLCGEIKTLSSPAGPATPPTTVRSSSASHTGNGSPAA